MERNNDQKMDDFFHNDNMCLKYKMHKSYAKPRGNKFIAIRPYGRHEPFISCDVSIPSAITIMEAIGAALVDLGAISAPKKEAKQNTTEFHSFSPKLLHPFVYAMDALITDPGLVKETRERLKVAVKYFNDPGCF